MLSRLLTSTFVGGWRTWFVKHHNKHCDIQQEESVKQSQPTQEELQKELNKPFARTIKLLEERKETHVQSAVDLLRQADSPPDSSERVFPNSKAVREAVDKFDQATHTCLHVTHRGQIGSRIRYHGLWKSLSRFKSVQKSNWNGSKEHQLVRHALTRTPGGCTTCVTQSLW
jgi:hypothetical protein